MSLINPAIWPSPKLERLVYCTAPRDREGDPSSLADQQAYIGALRSHIPQLDVREGKYVPRTKTGVLVDKGSFRSPPTRVVSPGSAQLPAWLPAKEILGPQGQGNELLVSVTTFEEKGSDVNVASSLLIDVLTRQIDAAIVISNDSDLSFPLRRAREHVPVATVNPTTVRTADDLRGSPNGGSGRHWWRRLRAGDFRAHQLPNPTGKFNRPAGW